MINGILSRKKIHRRITGVIADIHFAPTNRSRQNLLDEGVPEDCVMVTGNTIIDALHRIQALKWNIDVLGETAGVLQSTDLRLILVTAHRRENFGEPIIRICNALLSLAVRYRNVRFVYPVHRNPIFGNPCTGYSETSQTSHSSRLWDYLSLVNLMKRSYLVLTDSGGIQEEAPALGIPALVLREVTERPEGVESGNVKLVGSNPDRIIAETVRLLDDGATQPNGASREPVRRWSRRRTDCTGLGDIVIIHEFFVFLTALVAVSFLLSGIDDFFIDAYYWYRAAYRKLFVRGKIGRYVKRFSVPFQKSGQPSGYLLGTSMMSSTRCCRTRSKR